MKQQKLKVNVTQAHIDKATKTAEHNAKMVKKDWNLINKVTPRSQCCPIALAVNEAYGKKGVKTCWGWNSGTLLKGGNTIATIRSTTKKTGNFVYKFDGGKPVKPFTFNLTITPTF